MNKLKKNILKFIYRRRFRHYVNRLDFKPDPAGKTILAINHFYDQDYRALAHANKEFNFIIVDGPALARGARMYFSTDVIRLNAPYESEKAANRAEWRGECKYIFEMLMTKFQFDIIITPSDIFWWIREFIGEAHERGIKTVVLEKEGLISPYYFDAGARRIRTMAPFISDYLLVWSERQRMYWNKIGVKDDKIAVIGQARSDLFHHEKNRAVDAIFDKAQRIITLFSFEDTAYIPLRLAKNGMSWRQMKTELHDIFHELSRQYQEYNFVIKAHPQQSDLKAISEKYDGGNLRVIGGAALGNELIQRSALVIAFQTTAVIEAMYMNKNIIYACWDPNYERIRDDLLPYHDAPGILVARERDTLRENCRKFLDGDATIFQFDRDIITARDDFVNTYLYRPDGKVGERFFTEIKRLLA